MPVQDNDDKRKTEQPMVDAEEELRRKMTAVQEQQEDTSIHQTGKLLPFLNAKAEHHQSRLDTLESKIATQQDKIGKNEAKIEQLSDKADRLEDKNRILKATMGNVPLVQNFIQRNEERIADIRENKIPNRQQKIAKCKDKIENFSVKLNRTSHKLDRVVALNDTIKSFSIGLNKERREAFADAMSRLNKATVDCLTDKKNNLISQKEELFAEYNNPKTFIGDKLNIQKEINGINERISVLESKITKLARPDTHYKERTNNQLDASMKLADDKLGKMVQDGKVDMPSLADSAIGSAQEVETLDESKTAELAAQFHTAKEQTEDNFNTIDGIINNGNRDELEKSKADILNTIQAAEALIDSSFVSKDIKKIAEQDINRLQGELAAVDKALSSLDEVNSERSFEENVTEVQEWLLDMVADGKAEISDDGSFKINPDYYKELPRNDRHVESMTEAQSVAVMSALTAAGVEFSAASRGDGKTSITVSKKDLVALNDIMYSAIGKIAQTEAVKENAGKGEKGKYETINPEYYASLSKEQRYSRVEAKDSAREIVKGLMAEKIPYSAVVRKNDTVAVTVSKENVKAYKQIESKVKGERAAEYINPEFYKALPKEFRFTLPMTEEQARNTVKQLDKQGVAHSAVINGDKSAVTVSKKDSERAFFSRSKLKKEVQRISGQGKKPPQKQKTPKEKDTQGLD